MRVIQIGHDAPAPFRGEQTKVAGISGNDDRVQDNIRKGNDHSIDRTAPRPAITKRSGRASNSFFQRQNETSLEGLIDPRVSRPAARDCLNENRRWNTDGYAAADRPAHG
jgi:hypothetical protein